MIDRRPLVYYCISLLFGCYSAVLMLNNNYLGAVFLTASFLVCIFLTQSNKFFPVVTAFFILGLFNYIMYFEIVPPKNCSIRVLQVERFSSLGSYKGRKLILKGDTKAIKEGEILYVTGEYTSAPQFERGIIGQFDISGVQKSQTDVMSSIYTFKDKLYNKYKDEIGEEAAGEVMAAAFGDDSHLKSEAVDEMSDLGVIHVISVSGLHMALIYKICEISLGFGWGMVISLIYCLFTGAAPSTVRSLIMIIVFKLSKKVFKNYDPISSLSMAAMIILFIKPSNALDLGSILSFLSVLGIFLFYNKIKKVLYALPMKLDEYISLTLSAQVFSLPICVMTFNSISTASLQGNIFLVPIYSILLVLGNISLLFLKIDLIFEILCRGIKLVYLAIVGGKELLLMVSTGVLFMSYAEGWVIIIIYISYLLLKKGYKKFVWLPLFSIVFYLAYSFSPIPQFQYVKVGNCRGIIYRNGFNSVLFLDKSKVKDKEILLCKKFNVWSLRDIGKQQEALFLQSGKRFYVKINSDRIVLEYDSKKTNLKIVFVKDDIPVAKDDFYDIIYLPYDKNSYHYYDELANIKLLMDKPIIR